MNRRGFLKGILGCGAIAAFDPHRVIFDMAANLFRRDRWLGVDFGFGFDDKIVGWQIYESTLWNMRPNGLFHVANITVPQFTRPGLGEVVLEPQELLEPSGIAIPGCFDERELLEPLREPFLHRRRDPDVNVVDPFELRLLRGRDDQPLNVFPSLRRRSPLAIEE
jgi:hypothetical protein